MEVDESAAFGGAEDEDEGEESEAEEDLGGEAVPVGMTVAEFEVPPGVEKNGGGEEERFGGEESGNLPIGCRGGPGIQFKVLEEVVGVLLTEHEPADAGEGEHERGGENGRRAPPFAPGLICGDEEAPVEAPEDEVPCGAVPGA